MVIETMFTYASKDNFELDFYIVPTKDKKWFHVRNSNEIWDHEITRNKLFWKEHFFTVNGLRIGVFAWFPAEVDDYTLDRVFWYLENLVRPMFSGGSQYADQSLKRIN